MMIEKMPKCRKASWRIRTWHRWFGCPEKYQEPQAWLNPDNSRGDEIWCTRCHATLTSTTTPPPRARYVVIGGIVRSKNDDQLHYVGPKRLCDLYGVDREECILALDASSPALWGLRLADYRVLTPRVDGNYLVPEGERSEAGA